MADEQKTSLVSKFRTNWRPIISLILLLISVVLANIPSLQKYATGPLAAAVASLVLMVWDIQSKSGRKVSESAWDTYDSLQNATDDLIDVIIDEIKNLDSHTNLEIHAVGGRFRDIDAVIRRIVVTPEVRLEKIDFKFYSLDPQYMFDENPWPTAKEESKWVENNIDIIRSELAPYEARGMKMNFYKFCMPPIFYGFLVGRDTLFMGYYHWQPYQESYKGPEISCVRIERGDEGFSQIYDWCLNRCEQWASGC